MGKSPSYNALLILSSLADADRHGYAIRKDVAERSGGEVQLGSTTLYRMLGQLLDEGLLERVLLAARPALAPRSR
jgi:DNA-binding PadR family transcriptional regulator